MQIHLHISLNKIEFISIFISDKLIKEWYVYFGGQTTDKTEVGGSTGSPTRERRTVVSV